MENGNKEDIKTNDRIIESEEIKNFIGSLKLDKNSLSKLNSIPKLECPKCKKHRKFYCYDCMIPIGNEVVEVIPKVRCPVKVIVIQHPKELKSKSTAIHAKILSPDDVMIYQYPEIPPEVNVDSSIILYPSVDALSMEEFILLEQEKPSSLLGDKNAAFESIGGVKNIVFIDSTWKQSRSISRDPVLSKLKRLKLTSRKTLFWRYQQFGDDFLATIEAIYYALVDYIRCKNSGKYDGEVDNLLFFYVHYYQLIQSTYRQNKRQFRHKENYIVVGDADGNEMSSGTFKNTEDVDISRGTEKKQKIMEGDE